MGRSHDFWCASCRCYISGFDLRSDQDACDWCGTRLVYDALAGKQETALDSKE